MNRLCDEAEHPWPETRAAISRTRAKNDIAENLARIYGAYLDFPSAVEKVPNSGCDLEKGSTLCNGQNLQWPPASREKGWLKNGNPHGDPSSALGVRGEDATGGDGVCGELLMNLGPKNDEFLLPRYYRRH